MIGFLKKCILMLLLLSLTLFAGCGNENSTESPNDSTNDPIQQSDTGSINILMPQNQYKPRYENIDEWQSFIKEKFDIDIKVNYVSLGDYTAFAMGSYIENAITEGFSGLIYLWDSSERRINELAEKGLILPLLTYLRNNEIYNSLPQGMKVHHMDGNGETWAIPVMYRVVPSVRLMKSEWLENLDISIPSTIFELYETSKAFTYNDPDGNDKDDTFGIAVTRNSELRNLGDLFLANGCYLDPYGATSLSFDRETETYEDALLKPGAKATLDMISGMIDEKIINRVLYNSTWDFEAAQADGSFYYFLNLISSENTSILWGVTGTNEKNIVLANTGLGGYVVSKNTAAPQSVIDSMINTFYGSPDAYYMGFAGIPDIDYEINEMQFKNLRGNDGVRVVEGYAPYLKFNGYTFVDENDKTMLNGLEMVTEKAEELFNENKLFFTNIMDGPYDLDVNYSAKGLVKSLFDRDLSVDDLLTEYRNLMKKANAQELLDEKNEAIGKVTIYNYN